MSDGTDVLRAIDQLRHDLSGYHGQLKAHNDLQRHCDNQRERIGELEGLYANAKAERDEANMAFSKEHDRAEFLMRENARLRHVLGSYAKTFESWAAENNGNGRYMEGTDWLELANELRMERDGI